MINEAKPLGGKAYGSIPHLPNSRVGPGDYHCHEGQAIIATQKPRDKRDRIIVTEKLDGSNCAVARIDGSIIALMRSGYLANTSRYQMHHVFSGWVEKNTAQFAELPDGHRICGEWMHTAHGTIYAAIGSPFIAFDVICGKSRLPHDDARIIFKACGQIGAHVISDGPPLSVDDALAILGRGGFHGAMEAVEGAVWRVERDGAFDFMCKYVRPEKVDGKYLSGIGRDEPLVIWEDIA